MPIRYLDEQPAQGKGTIKYLAPEPTQQPDMLQRMGADVQRRGAQAVLGALQSTTLPEAALRVAGQTAGAGLDVVGEGVSTAFNAAAGVTPEFIKQPIREGMQALSESDLVQAGLEKLNEGIEEYGAWRQENPRAAQNIEAGVNIALVARTLQPAKTVKPTKLGKAADRLSASARAKEMADRKSFLHDLVLPKQTAKQRTEQVSRTVFDKFGNKVAQLSQEEAAIVQTLQGVKGLSHRKTMQENYNIVQSNLREATADLKSKLARNDVPIPRRESISRLNKALISLEENPLLTGDAAKTAEKILVKAKYLINENKGTASGLLEARKRLDNWVRKQKGSNVFDPDRENAVSIALREIRREMNSLIDEKATNVPVKESLRRQSNMFSALDNIAPKAADEAVTKMGRIYQRVKKSLPMSSDLGQTMAVTIGVPTTLAAASQFPLATSAFVSGVAISKSGKLVMSPTSRRAVSVLLREIDRGVKAAKDPRTIKALRADRAALLEIVKEAGITNEQIRQDLGD